MVGDYTKKGRLEILIDLDEPKGSVESGTRFLAALRFDEARTDFGEMLEGARQHLAARRGRDSRQMLIVVSDGRNALAERVKAAIAGLDADQVTVLFLLVDSGPLSVTEERVAEFGAAGDVQLVPYMQRFPFPFYAIVRQLNALPATMADAIRQWFEIVAAL